ncbi:Hypothetical protein PBC10988_37300 [Planctomycetales bacterium 10988]|nr:Hypothetical protein PBC10988_37300 [Planctomycetales bacterium 10988]
MIQFSKQRWMLGLLLSGFLIGCTSEKEQPLVEIPEVEPTSVPEEANDPIAKTPEDEESVIPPPPVSPPPLPELKKPALPPLPPSWKLVSTWKQPTFVSDLEFFPDSERFLSCGGSAEIYLWNRNEEDPESTPSPLEGDFSSLAISPNSEEAYLIQNDLAKSRSHIIHWKPKMVLPWLEGYNGQISALSIHPQGRWLATGALNSLVEVWDLEVQTKPPRSIPLRGHEGPIHGVSFSPSGNYLASGSGDQKVAVWDWQSEKVRHVFRGLQKWAGPVAFSSDDKQLASGGGEILLRLWNLSTMTPEAQWVGNDQSITALAFSPKQPWLAVGGGDGIVRVFDTTTKQPINELKHHTDYVNALSFSPDGKWLLSGSNDQQICCWQVPEK